ncbi:anti-sigma factor [Pigmentiphaga aceris]|uniref:Anti-sigma factor n=1 Tax=Pigmentiphaga aceris TaxID=1940612 RepID=A0A5C0AVU9_9BURK|nr:anti-sigma factor [Pigmentiphaga aceris]QEI05846.1 anti-sigma factor [Pigmentiphaga aceris]
MAPSHLKPVANDGERAVTEAELHAFVDGQLPPEQRDAIEDFLATHPAVRKQVEDWRAQNRAMKRLLDPVMDEPVPPRLAQAAVAPSWPWRGIAAGFALVLVSAGSAWWARGVVDGDAVRLATARATVIASASPSPVRTSQAESLPGFAQRAAVAHAVYSSEVRRPVEVGADQEQALVTWLTRRMDATVPVRPPDLRGLGYSLIGGRLLPGEKKPVAQFMFGAEGGQRLTLYVSREDAGSETSFRFGQDGAVNVFYWVDKDFGYAISAGADREELLRVSQAVYDQLSPR